MDDILKADIFFFITTIATIILSVFLGIVFFYTIRILHDIKHISSVAKKESTIISEELSELRENIKKRGTKLKYFLSFFDRLYSRTKRIKQKPKRKKNKLIRK
ncbi:hypothetical protein IIA94_01540 [Patescibacteria group bacterium]|nr:hypothetical protein [Patescibacteria group bacterium]